MLLQPDNSELIYQSLMTQAGLLASAATIDATGDKHGRDKLIQQILGRSAELMRGAGSLGRDKNPITLGIVARAILENLILILWVVISEENAREQDDAGVAELARLARINLESGKAMIRDRDTGLDATAEFFASERFKNLPKRKNVVTRAEEAGVADLYNIFYRFLSMEMHGHEVGKGDGDDDAAEIIHMQGIGALGQAIGHAGVRWLLHRERTDNETLRILLGLQDLGPD
jgi:hypothetical protein